MRGGIGCVTVLYKRQYISVKQQEHAVLGTIGQAFFTRGGFAQLTFFVRVAQTLLQLYCTAVPDYSCSTIRNITKKHNFVFPTCAAFAAAVTAYWSTTLPCSLALTMHVLTVSNRELLPCRENFPLPHPFPGLSFYWKRLYSPSKRQYQRHRGGERRVGDVEDATFCCFCCACIFLFCFFGVKGRMAWLFHQSTVQRPRRIVQQFA